MHRSSRTLNATILAGLLAAAGSAAAHPELAARVRSALEPCGLLPGSDVRVSARDGVVTLSGHVRTLHERECVAIQAERVEGVRFLEPAAVVRPAERLPDWFIAERAAEALRAPGVLLGPAPLSVTASKGRVVLLGQVRVPEDKYRAEEALRRVEGILELENAVVVDPEEGLRRMEVRLQELFRRRDIPVEDLRFLESEGQVSIQGRVHDVVARTLVEEFRRELPGGTQVVDRMRLILQPAPGAR